MPSPPTPSVPGPQAWDDPILLAHEPLLSFFTAWDMHDGRRDERERIQTLIKEIESQKYEHIVQTWLDHTFHLQPPKRVTVNRETISLFIRFQWKLYKKNPDVQGYIRKECVQRQATCLPWVPHFSTSAASELSTGYKKRALLPEGTIHKQKKKRKKASLLPVAQGQSTSNSSPKLEPVETLKIRLKKPSFPISIPHGHGNDSVPNAVSTSRPLTKWTETNSQKSPLDTKKMERQSRKAYKKQKKRNREKTSHSGPSQRRIEEEDRLGPSSPLQRLTPPTPPKVPSTNMDNGLTDMFALPISSASEPSNPHQDDLLLNAPQVCVGASSGPLQTLDDAVENGIHDSSTISLPTVLQSASLETIQPWSSMLETSQDYTMSMTITVFDNKVLLPIEPTDSGEMLVDIEPTLPTAQVNPEPEVVKQPLPRQPLIWAESRQEVCESFEWFKSYQGGVYYCRDVVKGYLLSAFSARRDVFAYEGKLIISHGGGKAQSVRQQGQYVTQAANDQLAQDKSVRALLSNFRDRRPLVLLIDDKYSRFPYDLSARNITYAVLGFYIITHAWAEYQSADNERGCVVRYKFAFRWLEQQGEPWWIASDLTQPRPGPNPSPLEPLGYVERRFGEFDHIAQISTECGLCHQRSPRVYTKSWTCLNPGCPKFWKDSFNLPLGDELEYNSDFLQLGPSPHIPGELNLSPSLLTAKDTERNPTDYAFTRGWHCKECGRLSSRYKWECWECMNCKNTVKVPTRIRLAQEFWYTTGPNSLNDHFVANNSGIKELPPKIFILNPTDGSVGRCHTFVLPEERGCIHHIRILNPLWNTEADAIFHEYQEQASTGVLPFRRWPMRAHKCRGSLLTNYFSQNAGVPYQYVGGTENTLPFDQVPAVSKARDLIKRRVREALEREEEFNEVLSAAYMQRQKMAFHTDDEIGLGPFVAGLSLGSHALMHFRSHAKRLPEREQKGIVLSLVLRHGDVLAMDGAGVQQYYEHTVVPTNFRIAATARYIDTKHPKCPIHV